MMLFFYSFFQRRDLESVEPENAGKNFYRWIVVFKRNEFMKDDIVCYEEVDLLPQFAKIFYLSVPSNGEVHITVLQYYTVCFDDYAPQPKSVVNINHCSSPLLSAYTR